MCGLCWFVFLCCSLIIGGIVCLAVCLMCFLRCPNLLLVIWFGFLCDWFVFGWLCLEFGVGGNVVLEVCILFV